MLRLTDDQVEAALFAVSDLVARRRMFGQPIPSAVVALRQQLLIAASVHGSENNSDAEQLEDELIDSDEAAEILGCSTRWVRTIITDLEGRKVAGRWVFHRQTVIDYAASRNHRETSGMA
ncbi:helix-turn-helix domain-containing protein [Mycobacterium riyadhense]|uniref:helix-turn-helix domain-containing protein n=1 Tax=Mycobacterium riyadhense TaxID=486698 RepID=UPI00195984CD|nr:helix-turn-helix domain-containing protein [Mycobacterium riyadhense]